MNLIGRAQYLVSEKLSFMYRFIRSPRTVGSIIPSSRFLAKAMVRPIDWSAVHHVVELGAGTGPITKELQKANSGSVKVTLFEKDPALRRQLQRAFPEYRCRADAIGLLEALQEKEDDTVDVILSGLPFFNFTQGQRDRFMRQIVAALKPGGMFIAFQYSLQMKKQLKPHFHIERIRFVPWNFPAAFVYICRKKRDIQPPLPT